MRHILNHISNITRFLKRLIQGDHATEGGAASMHSIIVWAFIALVAVFLTQPMPHEPASYVEQPIPLPAELGLGQ
jgi:cytochrome b